MKEYPKYFAFAKFLNDNFVFWDNTDNGDIYRSTINNLEFTEIEIYKQFLKTI